MTSRVRPEELSLSRVLNEWKRSQASDAQLARALESHIDSKVREIVRREANQKGGGRKGRPPKHEKVGGENPPAPKGQRPEPPNAPPKAESPKKA